MASCLSTAPKTLALQAKTTIANPIKLLKVEEKRDAGCGSYAERGSTAGSWALKETR